MWELRSSKLVHAPGRRVGGPSLSKELFGDFEAAVNLLPFGGRIRIRSNSLADDRF